MKQPPPVDTAPAGAPAGGAVEFAEVVSRYETPLLQYVGQVVGRDPGGAEDVVQEAFLRYHRQVARDGAGSVRSVSVWLFRVAHNLAIDALRRKLSRGEGKTEGVSRRQEIVSSRQEAGGSRGDEEGVEKLIQREAGAMAMEELRRLPADQRQALLLKIVHGMTLKEIGEVTGLTTGNVDYKIGQGLRELARRLKEAAVI